MMIRPLWLDKTKHKLVQWLSPLSWRQNRLVPGEDCFPGTPDMGRRQSQFGLIVGNLEFT